MVKGTWGLVVQRPGEVLTRLSEIPASEAVQTVRGFEFESISPRDAETGDRIGGEKMMYYTAEFRFPLVKGIWCRWNCYFLMRGMYIQKDENALTVAWSQNRGRRGALDGTPPWGQFGWSMVLTLIPWMTNQKANGSLEWEEHFN